MWLAAGLLLVGQILQTFSEEQFYPELRSDLQKFQDNSRCYPDIGEWYQIYRNYYYDPLYGGTAKCVMYTRYGDYQNFSTPAVLTYGSDGTDYLKGDVSLTSTDCYSNRNFITFVPNNNSADSIVGKYQVIYTDCNICYVLRHLYVDNGYGCSLWRRSSTFEQAADCCEFIYAENCGTTPKYQIYQTSCAPGLGMPGA